MPLMLPEVSIEATTLAPFRILRMPAELKPPVAVMPDELVTENMLFPAVAVKQPVTLVQSPFEVNC